MRVSVGLGLDVGASDTVGIELGAVEKLGAGETLGCILLGDTLGATDEDNSNFRLLSLLRSCPKTRNELKNPPLNAALLLSNESTTAM